MNKMKKKINNNVKIGDCFVRKYSTGSCRLYLIEDVGVNDIRGLCIYVSNERFSSEKFIFTHESWGYQSEGFETFNCVDFNIIKYMNEQYHSEIKDITQTYFERLHKILN